MLPKMSGLEEERVIQLSQKIIAETLFYDKQKEPVPQFIIKLINSRQTSFPFTTDLGGNHVTAEGKELLKPL